MAEKAGPADLAAIDAFKGLGPEALEECAALAVRRPLRAGELIFAQGDRCTRFQALLSGWLRISQAGRDGEQALIRFIGTGEVFGAFAIFGDRFYPAEAVAVSDSVELSWSEIHIRQLIERYPSIAVNIVGLAARRLGELQDRVREISTQPAEQRIASTLLRLSEKSGRRLGDGRIEIPLPLARRDVAALSATTLYTASRMMARWERNGIIASARKRISISAADLAGIADAAR